MSSNIFKIQVLGMINQQRTAHPFLNEEILFNRAILGGTVKSLIIGLDCWFPGCALCNQCGLDGYWNIDYQR